MLKHIIIVIAFLLVPFIKAYSYIDEKHDTIIYHCEHFECCDYESLDYTYSNVCWRCHSSINSNVNRRCSYCGWYICNTCGACDSKCSRCPAWNKPKEKKNYTWLWIILAGAAIGGGIYLYKRYNYNRR